ncbi:MAG: hypothetical protein NTY08_15740 [Proteobacteria bacterium]|nr:hypothetical protein [Pseudomonadota bacterium]
MTLRLIAAVVFARIKLVFIVTSAAAVLVVMVVRHAAQTVNAAQGTALRTGPVNDFS